MTTPTYAHATPTPNRTSGLAVAGFVLSLIWLGGLGALLAVIFGHVALSQMKRDARLGGRGLAVAALVLGYLGIIGLIFMIAAISSAPAYSEVY